MAEEQININVIIADRPYRLKVKPEEEENVRKAANGLNEKVKEFQQKYEGKDKQDYVSMAALMYAVEFVNLNAKRELDDKSLGDLIDSIHKDLKTQGS